MILAQLGADVIKVEPPGGDDSRAYASTVAGVSVVHSVVNAGKRGIVLDLKSEEGLGVALRLIGTADVVVQTMRPGTADKLGIGQGAARAQNPDVIYYDVSAFGAGPMGHQLPGYDPLVQAFTGILLMNGHADSPPTRCAPSVVDLGTGQWVAMGVLAALLARRNGQPVQSLETALVDTAFSLVSYQATSALVTGERPPRAGSGNPIAAPYQCYRASDGYVLVAAANQRLWLRVVRALAAPQLADDERFRTVHDRSAHAIELETEMNEVLSQAGVEEWIARFSQEGVPVGRVLGLEEAVTSPVVHERQTMAHSGDVPLVRLPWLVDEQPVPWRRPAPRLAEHTAQVLEQLGYDDQQIAELSARGVVTVEQPD
ncbi:MAG: CoA transferase [Acidimicrobiales bacterium]